MKISYSLILPCLLFILGCTENKTVSEPEIRPGTGLWMAWLELQGNEVPFNFYMDFSENSPMLTVMNADEKIEIEEIIMWDDSISFQFPVFDSEIRAKITDNSIMDGHWFNLYGGTDYIIPFHAGITKKGRFKRNPIEPVTDISGKWEATFSPGIEGVEEKTIGQFVQDGNTLTGTFLTTTGDKRFLEGLVDGDSLFLSTFDGAHAYLFEGKTGDTIFGIYYSGKGWNEPWTAVRNENFELEDPEKMTELTSETDKIDFTFPGLDGNPVSLSDPKYNDKPVIIQIMGSWCPNCKDESVLLSSLYDEYGSENLEVIALSFERTKGDFEKAKRNLERMSQYLGIKYTVLIAGTDRDDAKNNLPFIDRLRSYPTAIFIDRNKKVHKIHTGFSGPATGDAYTSLVSDYRATIEELIGS